MASLDLPMDKPFVIEKIYQSPIGRVWEVLTKPAQMRQWYFHQLQHFEPVIGFRFEFTNDGSAYQKKWTVTDVVDTKKLAHDWSYDGYPGRSEVTFELFDEGEKTRLRLTHTGLASFPEDPHFARERFESGWENILGNNLNNFLERSK